MNIHPDKTPNDVFYEFLNNSVISYVGAGSSGLGLLSTNTINDSYKILTTNNENVVCTKIFIKLVPIYTDMDARIPSFSLLLPGMYSASIYSNAELDFWNEVYLQSKIYKKTNEFLEAVCPPIVYSECLDNTSSIELLKKLFSLVDNASDHDMSDDPMFELYDRYYMNNSTLKLGIIGMGFTEGYTSLYSMFRNNYPNITRYFDLAIYELLRLYSAGYIHGDFSLANIMINTDYNYTGTNSGRAMLIDFGMTFRHNYKDRDIPVILQKMLRTATPYSGITPMEHGNYRWFVNYITNNLEDITISIKNLNQMITAHIHKMVDMIDIRYPEVLANIRMYNDTEQHTNIFNGGFKNRNDVYEVENKMFVSNPMISKPDSKVLSMIEFNRIFNPNNLNIPQLLDAYLRTLHLGEETIQVGIKRVKGKMGGKKQKRSSRNRTRKQKIKRRRAYRSKKSYRRR